ncbi:MAG: response regulator [Candidatus Delongbacteria bacterium]|nr:response regulator [Candidatus Delongbacteria bacterium]MBN2835796.1 response regulator [Candidatus Delongbacteria bacterium]
MSDKKMVLLVDDDIDFIESYTLILEKEGFEIKSALSSEEGLKIAKNDSPNLIILDVMMESADSGFEFAEALKEGNFDIPIILSSSIAAASGRNFDLNDLNVRTVLQKPVDIDKFIALCKKYAR